MQTQLILIRGLPGSGKSTIARAMTGFEHYEADMFFESPKGSGRNYQYDPRMTKAAHAWCLEQTQNAIADNRDVVVANTFSMQWEMRPYYDIDECDINVITARGHFQNIHNVPASVIEKMRRRWERFI